MRRSFVYNFAVIVLLFALTLAQGCTKGTTGAAIGAGLGGTAGALTFKNKMLGGALGAGAGMLLGYGVGTALDVSDLQQAQRLADSQRSGIAMQWSSQGAPVQLRGAQPATLNSDGLISRNVDIVRPDGSVIKATFIRNPSDDQWELVAR